MRETSEWTLLHPGDPAQAPPSGCTNMAAWNMAFDEAALDDCSVNDAPLMLRLYRWSRPALTIGRFQSASGSVDLEACTELSIPVARRITGGRGVLHGGDVTAALVARTADLGIAQDAPVAAIYRHLSEIFIAAYAAAGVQAKPGPTGSLRLGARVGDCFMCPTEADVISEALGSKLVGAAIHIRRGAVVLQASMQTSESEKHGWIASRIFQSSSPSETCVAPDPLLLVNGVIAAATSLFGSAPCPVLDPRKLARAATKYAEERAAVLC